MRRSGPANVLYCENNVDGTVGGSYYSLLYLVKGIDRSKYNPIVIFYTDHRLLPAFREAGVETLLWRKVGSFAFAAHFRGALGWLRAPMLVLQKGLNFVSGFLVPALQRAWFLRRRHVRLVHLNNSVLYNHDWMLASRLTGIPCVTHERGINERFPAAAKHFGAGLKAVICISEAVRDNMRRRGADFGNLVTIHNGLDPAMMRITRDAGELRKALGLNADAIVVGMIGNIKAWKGQDTLIRAIDHVRGRVPSVRCVLVGDTSPADREYEQSLRALVGSLGLERHVIFTGFQQHVADFLMMFDVVVHASVLPEPFGRVILEAMACRKPVIGARAGAIPEIVDEGKTGLTFEPGDAAALADAALRLVEDPEHCREMGERGYERLVRQFDISQNIKATERLYESWLRASA